jgi:hypothetical protein
LYWSYLPHPNSDWGEFGVKTDQLEKICILLG